jgi:hypothetical protein
MENAILGVMLGLLMALVLVSAILWWGPNTDYIYTKCTCEEDEDDDNWSGYRKRNPWATAVTWMLPFIITWTTSIYLVFKYNRSPSYAYSSYSPY